MSARISSEVRNFMKDPGPEVRWEYQSSRARIRLQVGFRLSKAGGLRPAVNEAGGLRPAVNNVNATARAVRPLILNLCCNRALVACGQHVRVLRSITSTGCANSAVDARGGVRHRSVLRPF